MAEPVLYLDSYTVGDCRELLRLLPDDYVNCVVTSPPYWGLRSYLLNDHPAKSMELGTERTPQEYVDHLVEVFHEVWRVLRLDGTCWLVLSDCYNAYNGNCGPSTGMANKQHHEIMPRLPSGYGLVARDLKNKDLIGLPWLVALALRADGWFLRRPIIWAKPNPQPESVKDRPTRSYEYVFLLTKSARYYYDCEAGREEAVGKNLHDRTGPGYSAPGQSPNRGNREKQNRAREPDGRRNLRDVWWIPTEAVKEAHFATFPRALAARCVELGCPPGGIVLDPFGGSGTVALVAEQLGRHWLLFDLNPDYPEVFRQRAERLAARRTS